MGVMARPPDISLCDRPSEQTTTSSSSPTTGRAWTRTQTSVRWPARWREDDAGRSLAATHPLLARTCQAHCRSVPLHLDFRHHHPPPTTPLPFPSPSKTGSRCVYIEHDDMRAAHPSTDSAALTVRYPTTRPTFLSALSPFSVPRASVVLSSLALARTRTYADVHAPSPMPTPIPTRDTTLCS